MSPTTHSQPGGVYGRLLQWMYKRGRPNGLARVMNRMSAIHFATGLLLPIGAATVVVVG